MTETCPDCGNPMDDEEHDIARKRTAIGQVLNGTSTGYGENPKDRIGVTKPSLHLVPAAAMIRMAKVFELGAAKYGPYNWRDNAVKETVYLSAALRHILSRLDGEDIDPESGQAHTAHVAACMSILLDAEATGNLVDDRPTKGVAAQLIRDLQVTNG